MEGNFYFGCWGETGHFLFGRDGLTRNSDTKLPHDFPVQRNALKCLLPLHHPQIEGLAVLIHTAGWTILTFRDNSIDKRPGSHSVFLMRGALDFEGATDRASRAFPEIWKRYKFEVVLTGPGAA